MLTLRNGNDTYASQGVPATKYAGATTLATRSGSGVGVRSYLTYEGVPAGPSVVVARMTLRMYATTDLPAQTHTAKRVTEGWTASKVDWNHKPATTATDQATVTGAVGKNQPVEFDVTHIGQLWAAGTPNFGLEISSSSSALSRFHSMNSTVEGGKYKPVLEVEWAAAPLAPAGLNPAHGQQVSLARPTLSWIHGDPAGSKQAAYRVQMFNGELSSSLSAPAGMSERIASLNVNGIAGSYPSFPARVAGIASKIVASGASAVLLQEANSTSSPNQPGALVAALAATGSTGWQTFPGSNLNVIGLDTDVWLPQATKVKDIALGGGKYACTLPVKHIETGVEVDLWTTHFFAGDEYADQRIAGTNLLIRNLATSSRPQIGGGDLNTASKVAGKPLALFAQAGHLEVRGLVDAVTNGAMDSLSKYGEANATTGTWVDHLFVSGGPVPTAVGLIDTEEYADHNLIWTDIEYATARATVGSFGAATYDTGEVASSLSQHTLTVDIEDGTGAGWRVQTKNAAGQWSPWSPVAPFGRTSKQELTILSPAPAPDNTVTEYTPPHIWDFAGVQTAFQLVTMVDATSAVQQQSPVEPGDDVQYTHPLPLSFADGDLRDEVRVWDDVDRAATPGDPPYTVATQVYGYEPTSSLEVPANVVAQRVGVSPVLELTWSLSTAPDSYTILRDGVPYVTDLAPSEVLVAGTAYRYLELRSAPWRKTVWQVQAVTNGVSSEPSEPLEVTVESQYIWLIDPEDPDWWLALADVEPGTWDMGEESEVHEIRGASQVAIVFHALRGYEGSISGGLYSDMPGLDGLTAQQLRDRAMQVKKQRTHLWRLVLSDLNIPVVVRKVVPTPTPDRELQYSLSFEFYQQGETPWDDN